MENRLPMTQLPSPVFPAFDSLNRSAIKISAGALRIFRRAWTTFMVVATSLPYLLNLAATPRGYHYTWILPPYPEDSFGYMAWSQQAARGALLLKIKYTALPQSAFLFQPFFLICGWSSRLFHSNIGAIQFIFKEAGVILFFLILYKYSDYLRLSPLQSMIASVLVGVSSGFGGIVALLGGINNWQSMPADTWMPEVSTYWALLWNPLFPCSLALMLLTIYYLDRGTRDHRKNDLWLAGLSCGVLALIHPYSQPLLLAIAVVLIVVRVRTKWAPYLFRYLAIAAPVVLYLFLVSKYQPIVAQHSSRGSMPSPGFAKYLLGFGLPLLIWVAGWGMQGVGWMRRYWQLVLWLCLSLAFAYLPFWYQRKLILGAHIPLCMLAAISLEAIARKWSTPATFKWALTGAAFVLLPVMVATPTYLLTTQNREVRNNVSGAYYISDEMDDGLRFLKQHSSPDEVVFATPNTSRVIPAFAGNTVVWGHWAMSVDLEARQKWADDLLSRSRNWDDQSRAEKFWSSGIDYIFADGVLKRGITKNPWEWWAILSDADEVFRNDEVVIYKHRKGL